MGILNGPRINFWGGIRTNVSLPNNDPIIPQTPKHPEKTLHIFDLARSTVAQEAQSHSDADLMARLNEPAKDDDGNPYFTAGGWNHYGDHVVDMHQVKVSSQGPAGAVTTTGDLVDEPVYLLGSQDPQTGQGPFSGPMMVDLDPTSSQTTQIIVGGLLIGSMDNPKLLIRGNAVCSSHDVMPRLLHPEPDAPKSSRISGTFQLTFPKSGITQRDKTCQTLNDIIDHPHTTGLVVRFTMFEMAPYMTTDELVAAYKANRNTPNPSVGHIIGTLGPAFADEPATCPPGRQLYNVNLPSAGYAIINGADSLVSVDMVNLVPKEAFRADRKNYTGPIGPNVDYGTMTLHADQTELGTIGLTASDYYVYGGIADVAVDRAGLTAATNHALSIKGAKAHDGDSLAIQEQPLRLFSNSRNYYMDERTGTLDIDLRVQHLGGPVTADTTIDLNSGSSGPLLSNPEFLHFPTSVTVDAGHDSVTVHVKAKDGSSETAGFEQLVFKSGKSQYFVNFRQYAFTDFGIPKGSQITWDQAYEHVLRFHYLAFPAMNQYIPLNAEDAIYNHGKVIVARTSELYRPTTLYMPVVRSMSPSQVRLLRAYLTNTPWDPHMSIDKPESTEEAEPAE